jgi:hypothetical protein
LPKPESGAEHGSATPAR